MRQAGIIAAAGLYAFENNIDRLAEDHDNAALLGKALAEIDELDVSLQTMHTNMVFFKSRDGRVEELTDHLASREILIEPGSEIRLVTHMQVSAEDVATAEAIKAFTSNHEITTHER